MNDAPATTETSGTSYDTVPYESHPYDRTHPDNLATIGRLFGMQPPDPETARVLELGCASGGNLIPLAASMPEARFLGVDLSPRQIDVGRALVAELGLSNIELERRSIAEVAGADGPFDYVICHGVYSWVPPDVQDAILRVCSESLATNGVAYVSYNTYPGWFMRGMVRRMMLYHARQFEDPQMQVKQSRALLDFLIEAGPVGDETYHALLKRELEVIKNRHDSYIFHEHLETDNEPCFFHEFIEKAGRHELAYLGEAQFSEMLAGNFSKRLDETMRRLGAGLIHAEQYLDFLRNRTFRRTLLCRNGIPLNRRLGPEHLREMYVATRLAPVPVEQQPAAGATFQAPNGTKATVSHPLVKLALERLGSLWPDAMRFEDLLAACCRDSGSGEPAAGGPEANALGGALLELFARDLVELRVRPPRWAVSVDERPAAPPLARRQAREGRLVTSLKHQPVRLSDLGRHLIALLDGTNDRERLLDDLDAAVLDGRLRLEENGRPVEDAERRRKLLADLRDAQLEAFRREALLAK
ncbi:MAG: class I SAM-dependent methyltransferase [Planctomycetes bacterium]|nr:class I SAM-dependent methyltransferase [Planctomycetota bacterium]